jgi:hypothetical protein
MPTITLEVPDELAAHWNTLPNEDKNRYAVATLQSLLDDDSQAIEEINDALKELEAAEQRGDYGLSLDDAFAELERRATFRLSGKARD